MLIWAWPGVCLFCYYISPLSYINVIYPPPPLLPFLLLPPPPHIMTLLTPATSFTSENSSTDKMRARPLEAQQSSQICDEKNKFLCNLFW